MRRAGLTSIVALSAFVAACGGTNRVVKGPGGASGLPEMVARAVREEARGTIARATEAWLGVLDAAVAAPDDPWQLPAEEAAVDALVVRSISSLSDASEDDGIAYRTNDGSFDAAPPSGSIAGRLGAAAKRARDPFSAAVIARALDEIATHRGDAQGAATWRGATACVPEATIIGPLTWTAVTSVHAGEGEDPLARGDAAIAATYASSGAFAPNVAPVVARGRGCAIDPELASVEKGVRDVVVDAVVERAGTIGVSLHAHSAATLRVGGVIAIDRPYALGGDETIERARVVVPRAGTVRLVARVGLEDDGESIEIAALDAEGKPLAAHAPKAGEAANVLATSAKPVAWPTATSDAERTALAVAAMAVGERATAEEATATAASRDGAPPELLLAYARAVEDAPDLDTVHRAERARGAYERVLDAWPDAWEAIVAHAVLAGVRRGQSEQRIWTLRDLDEQRAKAHGIASASTLDLFEAAVAGHDHLFDRANAALERATKALPPGVSLVHDAAREVGERAGVERVAFECSTASDADRARLGCYDALRATGDRASAWKELERIRTLYGAPGAYLAIALRDAIADGDSAAAARAFDAMLPGERTLSALYAAKSGSSPADLRAGLTSLALVARDAPVAIPPLLRAAGDDPTAPFAGIAERVAAADHASPVLPSAATAVLAHDERYDLSASGVLHFVLFDVRRVSGTTDVDQNAQTDPPELGGRTAMRILRRRIFKKDGRVIEPERNPNASQAHADLSQLEQGDIIEAIYEGWTTPGSTGNVVLDTPDLLPERTAVHEASIELRLPAALRVSLWAHPALGKAAESRSGDTRILRWTVKDAAERRIEEATPRMDRDVAVSLSTATWEDTARALRETIASLDDRDPEVRTWALAAAKGRTTAREIVSGVVAAAGDAVKESSASTLSDVEIGRPDGAQETTARTILSNQEGSRTWLIVRALRELGIGADIVLAENEPFSSDPAYPPHEGRFTHPLAVAHVKGDGGATEAVWVDADVAGPPLPAGKVSPELRGRAALYPDGKIEPLPSTVEGDAGERDEVDVRLALDARGDAKGQLTVLLRGRAAQELAEALVRIVGDERQRTLRGVALAWVPYANVDEVVLSSSEESWQVALRATLTVPGYAQAEAKTWILPGLDPIHAVYPRPTVATLGSTFASQGGRKDALAVNHAIQYHVHRRVELPPGTSVARAPAAFDVHDEILAAQRRVAVSPNAVEDEFSLSVSTGTVGADSYARFSSDAHAIDDGFLASTRLKPAP